MSLAKVLGKISVELDNGIVSALEKADPKVFRIFTQSDFPKVDGSGIFLCRGALALRLVGCYYTHCALYYRGMVYECIEGIGVIHVTLDQFLAQYIHKYDTVTYWQFSEGFEQTSFARAYRPFDGKPYEKDGIEMIRALFHSNVTENNQSFICSEFVGKMLSNLGFVTFDTLANNLLPDDFIGGRVHWEKNIKLQRIF